MNSKFKRDFLSQLEEKLAVEVEAATTGQLDNMKEYGLACGRIMVLRECKQDFEQLWGEFFENESEYEEYRAGFE